MKDILNKGDNYVCISNIVCIFAIATLTWQRKLSLSLEC